MNVHEKINYIELPAQDIEAVKAFFQAALGWKFTDYSPDYTAFSDEGLDGGFFKSNLVSTTANGSALLVFYSQTLEDTLEKITKAGGTITKAIFEFPGG